MAANVDFHSALCSQPVPDAWELHEEAEQNARENMVDPLLQERIQQLEDDQHFEAEELTFADELKQMASFAANADDESKTRNYILQRVPPILKRELNEYIFVDPKNPHVGDNTLIERSDSGSWVMSEEPQKLGKVGAALAGGKPATLNDTFLDKSIKDDFQHKNFDTETQEEKAAAERTRAEKARLESEEEERKWEAELEEQKKYCEDE